MYRIVILICVCYYTFSDVRIYDSYNKSIDEVVKFVIVDKSTASGYNSCM